MIELEGHTEGGFKTLPGDYGSWEVSMDEAKLARQWLLKDGVNDSQIVKISGYAGTRPLKDRQPSDRSNRRVTIMIRAGREPE
jgi:chemotaxis protein MotB